VARIGTDKPLAATKEDAGSGLADGGNGLLPRSHTARSALS
jgi:hypothetical protein